MQHYRHKISFNEAGENGVQRGRSFTQRVLVKPRPHQQQCRSNIIECYKSNNSFDKVECCLNIVAVYGNNVEVTLYFVERIVRIVAFNNVVSNSLPQSTNFSSIAAFKRSILQTDHSKHLTMLFA